MESVQAYFSEQYLDAPTISRRRDVCLAVGRWLDAHSLELAESGLVLDNGDGTASAPAIVFAALWDYFAGRAPEELDIDTSAAHFVSRYFPDRMLP